mmetsp:Transcript_20760/g.26860  ORF Transcript_20760/g.26860 Transcript_20760/m.26860 type:complete len:326 (-) Transcript_20760:74-1051(-)
MPFYIVDQADVAKTFYSIWTAAEYGDEGSVVAHVEGRGLDPGILDDFGYSAVHLAAQHDHVNIVRYLLSRGAGVDGGPASLCTPLHRAAFAGSLQSARILIDAGANLEKQDLSFNDKRTPLHKAVQHVALVNLLLERGASVHAVDASGATPLHVAATCGNSQSIQSLLNAGALLKARDHQGLTPAYYAARAGHANIATFLNDGQPISYAEDDHLPQEATLSAKDEPVLSLAKHGEEEAFPALGYVDTTTGTPVVVRNTSNGQKRSSTRHYDSSTPQQFSSCNHIEPLDLPPQHLRDDAAAEAASSIFAALQASDARRRQRNHVNC